MNKSALICLLGFICILPYNYTIAHELEVLAFGDSGSCNEDEIDTCIQNIVARSMKKVCDRAGCDLGILLGDNIYENSIDIEEGGAWDFKFEYHYEPLNFKIYASLGNHDILGKNDSDKQIKINAQIQHQNYSNTWMMPDEYYSFRRNDVEFFSINSNNFNRKQYNWLRSKLKNSTAKWKVVFGHHPIRTNGFHKNDADLKELVAELLPLICSYADMYVSGHDHDLQLLKSDCDIPLIISGAAGKSRTTDTSPDAPRRIWSKGKEGFEEHFGFARILFDNSTFTVRFYDENGDHLYSSDPMPKIINRKPPTLVKGSVRILSKNNEKCFHASGSVAIGSGHDIYKVRCGEKPGARSWSDRYYIKPSSSHPGSYRLVNKKYDSCVHTSRSYVVDSGYYQIYHKNCSSHPGDYFELQYQNNGYWKIHNQEYGTCLHGSNSVDRHSGLITFYDRTCYGTSKQLFRFER